MNQPLLILALLLCAQFCRTTQAAEAVDELYRLQQIRLLSQATLSDFYLLYGVDQAPARVLAMQRRLQSVNTLLVEWNSAPANATNVHLSQLEAQWQAYAQQLELLTNNLQQQLSPSPLDLGELLERNRQLLDLCAALANQDPASSRAPLEQRLSLLLQNLSTQYIAYSIGANALGGERADIDQLAREFDAQLLKLQQQAAANPQNQVLLASIQRKWRFIAAPLQHYNSQATVPFLVNQYAGRIIELLAQLRTTDSGTSHAAPASEQSRVAL